MPTMLTTLLKLYERMDNEISVLTFSIPFNRKYSWSNWNTPIFLDKHLSIFLIVFYLKFFWGKIINCRMSSFSVVENLNKLEYT